MKIIFYSLLIFLPCILMADIIEDPLYHELKKKEKTDLTDREKIYMDRLENKKVELNIRIKNSKAKDNPKLLVTVVPFAGGCVTGAVAILLAAWFY